MKINFSDILRGQYITVNGRYAVKINNTEIMYADDNSPNFQEFAENQELEIEDDNDNT
mgnify:CR=1 FL=1